MQLQYLIFDASDDGEGTGSWEAMASVRAEALPTVMAEVRAVEAAAHADAPRPRGALDDGGPGTWTSRPGPMGMTGCRSRSR
jgi:hypothetical protein